MAVSICYLGYAERGLGNVATTLECLTEALRLGLELRSQWPLVTGIDLWALLLADAGRVEQALELHFSVLPFNYGRALFGNVMTIHQSAVAEIPYDVVAAIQRRSEARTLPATAREILSEIERRGNE